MPNERPPTIDPTAAARWADWPADAPAWLHEEVGRRMAERLQWIKLQPLAWADWEPVRGGLAAHAAVAQRYPAARCYVVEPAAARAAATRRALRAPWWSPERWTGGAARLEAPAAGTVQMVWANMALHMSADPQALIRQWQQALAPEGFLMFSCLGPDSLREIRDLYRAQGWAPPTHAFTDMHDWGDMLVQAGFAEPVMDMERITLTFSSGRNLLDELRQLGRNLHPMRFAALRGRGWRDRLLQSLDDRGGGAESAPLALTFEIIYGHALKAQPRLPVRGETSVPLEDMRRALQQGKGVHRGRV